MMAIHDHGVVDRSRTQPSRYRRIGFFLALAAVAMVLRFTRRDHLTDALEAVHRAGHPTSGAELDARWPVDPVAREAGEVLILAAREVHGDDQQNPMPTRGSGRITPVEDWDPEERGVAGIIRSNDLARLHRVHEALKVPDIRLSGDHARGITGPCIEVFGFITTAKVLAWAAEWEVQEDPSLTSSAFERLEDGMEISRLLSREYGIVAQIGALAVGNITLRGIERVVSRTTATEEQWAALQTTLERSRTMDRSVRALEAELCFGLSAAEIARTNIAHLTYAPAPGRRSGVDMVRIWLGRAYSGLGLLRPDVASYVRFMGRYLEASLAHPRERTARIAAVSKASDADIAEHRMSRRFCAVMRPRVFHVANDDLRLQSRTEAAIAAVAIERYRLAHSGALPGSLDDLVPRFLPSVPLDPYGLPIRLRPLDRGYLVYGVDGDLEDNQGTDLGGGTGPGEDVAFRVLR